MDTTETTPATAPAAAPTSVRGVIVEFDFTVVNGADLLFKTAKAQLAKIGVELDARLEAEHLMGGSYQGALAELFQSLKKKNDAAKAARELHAAFNAALTAAAPAAITPAFKGFLKGLADKGVKIVIDTRADLAALKPALEGFDPALVIPYAESSMTYGCGKWDAWRRACAANKLRDNLAVGVTGSGFGVKAALVAGLAAVAVANPRTAYQDFGGADDVVDELNVKLIPEILRILHLEK